MTGTPSTPQNYIDALTSKRNALKADILSDLCEGKDVTQKDTIVNRINQQIQELTTAKPLRTPTCWENEEADKLRSLMDQSKAT